MAQKNHEKEAVGDFHPMAVVVEILRDLLDDLGQFGRVLAPFRIAQDVIERNFLTHRETEPVLCLGGLGKRPRDSLPGSG